MFLQQMPDIRIDVKRYLKQFLLSIPIMWGNQLVIQTRDLFSTLPTEHCWALHNYSKILDL
jgi:hypothetical protein